MMARVGRDRFWIDLTAAPPTGPVARWLAQPHPIRFQGIGYLRLPPAAAYDVLIYFSRIEPARTR
jgi:hypothetical protein